jgi:hypothetical protein
MSNISSRQQVALNLLDTCVFGALNDAYGASCERSVDSKGKSHWSVLFCKARVLDGVIRVYSDRFILITWQGLGTRNGKFIAKSEAEAKDFLVSQFVKRYL